MIRFGYVPLVGVGFAFMLICLVSQDDISAISASMSDLKGETASCQSQIFEDSDVSEVSSDDELGDLETFDGINVGNREVNYFSHSTRQHELMLSCYDQDFVSYIQSTFKVYDGNCHVYVPSGNAKRWYDFDF